MDVISYVIGRQAGKTPLQEKTLDITANGTTEALPDAGFALSKVTINTNVESGGGGGGAELNIAYGDTAPEDTSKLWVKTSEPSAVIVSSTAEFSESAGDGAVETKPLSCNVSSTLSGRVGCAAGLKYYYFGGQDAGLNTQKTITCYNAETNTYATISTVLPDNRYSLGVVAVGTKIYLLGGVWGTQTAKNTIFRFDSETETITTLSTTLPRALYGARCREVGSKIYIFGGRIGINASQVVNTIYCYDTEAEVITTMSATLPNKGTSTFAWPAYGAKIYLNYGTTLYRFDTETGAFDTLSVTLPVAKAFFSIIGNKYYCFGFTNDDSIYFFDTETETFGTLPAKLPVAASAEALITDGNRVYLNIGGEVYLLAFVDIVLAENALQIIPKIGDTQFAIINDAALKVEIGVEKVYKGNAENIGKKVEAALYTNGAWTTI